jgi:histidyl-tRNA synthetase
MFRYERPQKGRFRQFYQIGAEAFGVAEPKIDAEILAMLREYLNAIGLNELTCEINSIGCEDCRPSFRTALRDFFHDRQGALCPDCQRRFTLNPLRILDCKVEACIGLRKGSPHVTDFLCGPCKEHFETLLSLLKLLDLPYVINPELVRGLDYYTRTTFEITTEHLGAQKAVAAGGRYDRLVSEFGGPPTAAIGFAIGMERLAALMKTITVHDVPVPKVVIAALGAAAEREGLLIAQRLRKHGIWAELGYDNKSLKSQMRRADKLGADYVLIMGDDEINSGILKWKRLSDKTQGEIPVSEAHTMFIRQHQAFLP